MLAPMRVLLAVLLFAVGCDTKAAPSEPARAAARPEQASREHETCGATLHCADGLRCVDHTCRRTARSVVGDYHAAVGAAAHARGDHAAATAAYAAAVTQYESEKVEIPTDLDCAHGAALAAGKSNKENAEQAARVLHRCLLASPAGSSLRTAALGALATLADAGLDPAQLAGTKPADVYLTKAAAKPSADKLAVEVQLVPMPPKTGATIVAKLGDDAVKAQLVDCWKQHSQATGQSQLVGSTVAASVYVPAEYEDEPGRHAWKTVAIELPDAPQMIGPRCVAKVADAALKTVKPLETMSSKVTIVIK